MRSKNNSGFSLVEIMIAAAMLGGLSLAFMSMNKTMTQSKVKNDVDSEVMLITNEIIGILSSPTFCLATFGGLNATSGSVSGIKQNGIAKYAISGGPYGNAQVTILSYGLSVADSDVSLATNTAKLVIGFKRKNAQGGVGNIIRKIKLYVEVDSSSNITRCRSLSTYSTEIWSRVPNSPSVFYTDNVGVGNPAPSEKLDVTGNIKSSGTITASSVSATSFTYTSDKRLKKNITEIKDPLQTVMNLHGVKFVWKLNEINDVGFIAQEVGAVIPEIVKYSDTRSIYTVDYAKIVPYLVEAMKTQQKTINRLEKEMEKLKQAQKNKD